MALARHLGKKCAFVAPQREAVGGSRPDKFTVNLQFPLPGLEHSSEVSELESGLRGQVTYLSQGHPEKSRVKTSFLSAGPLPILNATFPKC